MTNNIVDHDRKDQITSNFIYCDAMISLAKVMGLQNRLKLEPKFSPAKNILPGVKQK